MITFLAGLAVLIIGGFLYGKFCEKVFGPDDRQTPAESQTDGVDYVALPKWKNGLIQLLNIAGTGPILGPIQGILFGPIAFITIPIGCIIGGAMHDYMTGMISVRNEGNQMPELIKKFLGKGISKVYAVFVMLVLILVSAVFVYTPGDLLASTITGGSDPSNIWLWVIYGVIFLYYLIATIFPIDKIIGKIYPVFGGILLISAVGVLAGILIKGYPLTEVWNSTNLLESHPLGQKFFPVFFVTVSCGIVSGFHTTQTTLVSRTLKKEKDGRTVFYNMMIAEGVIAMIWAAAAMGVYNMTLADATTQAVPVLNIICGDFLGPVGGTVAMLGVVVLAITSGDTALRSARLAAAETLKIPQKNAGQRMLLSACLSAIVAFLLIFAKTNSEGFNLLWRYFGWSNQVAAVFAFTVITLYLKRNHRNYIISLIPGAFYMAVVITYIMTAEIGFRLSGTAGQLIGGAATLIYILYVIFAKKDRHELTDQH